MGQFSTVRGLFCRPWMTGCSKSSSLLPIYIVRPSGSPFMLKVRVSVAEKSKSQVSFHLLYAGPVSPSACHHPSNSDTWVPWDSPQFSASHDWKRKPESHKESSDSQLNVFLPWGQRDQRFKGEPWAVERQSQACSPLFCLVSWGKFACDFPNFVSSFLADIYSLLIQQMCQALFNALLSLISL